MRICKVWDSEYPWDVRAAKVARSLTEAGHEVHMVARNRDNRLLEEELEECTVHRLAPLPIVARFPIVGPRLNSASMFPAFFNPRWIRAIHATASRLGAEVILCRDLPLVPSAVWVGRRLGIPVVLDMAENYPAMIRAVWENGRQRWSDWLVRNPKAIEWVEQWAIRKVDHIVVVVEESRDRLLRMGVPGERITIVSNTPPGSHSEHAAKSALRRGPGDPLELIYLGLLEAPRGIETLIRATGLCRDQGKDVRLSLIGDGRERQDFEELARRLDRGSGAIRFLGYLPNAEALALLRDADAGIIPHHADEAWNTTIPNKLFDYMAAEIPVIASDSPPVKRIIEATECGLIFRDRDPVDLARILGRLFDEPELAHFGRAGRKAVASRYNWEADAGHLVAALQGVVGEGTSRVKVNSSNRPSARAARGAR